MAHKPTYLHIENEPPARAHRVRCKCGWLSGNHPSKQASEDEFFGHLKVIDKVRAHLRSTPTLKGQRDYYLMMAGNETVPPDQREQWQVLADELSHRLDDGSTTSEQLRLL